MDNIKSIYDINQELPEGKLLYASIALINTELKRHKNPDDILDIIKEIAYFINKTDTIMDEKLIIDMNLAVTTTSHNDGGISYEFNNKVNGSFPAELKLIGTAKKLEPGYYRLTIEKID